MSQPSVNSQPRRKPNTSTFNPPYSPLSPQQVLTEDQVKKIVTEMLIAFNLIPKAQKKKGITIE